MTKTLYKSDITKKQIKDNNIILQERLLVYEKEGLDFFENREFILEKSGLTKRKVLDIGTGRGLTAISLAKAGHMVTSVDVEEEILRIAALNVAYKGLQLRVDLYKMDAYSMDFDNEIFGAVFMVEAVHHIENIEELLKEIDRVLIAGGKIVLSDFNKRGMSIVDKVHKREGNEHPNLSTGPQKSRKWLTNKGYKLDIYNNKCHWVIVAEKK